MAAVEAEAIPSVEVQGVNIDERLEELRDAEREYVRRIGRMTGQEEREYMRVVREVRRLESLKRRQERPSFMQRVSTYLTRRTTVPVMPVEEDIPVARFME